MLSTYLPFLSVKQPQDRRYCTIRTLFFQGRLRIRGCRRIHWRGRELRATPFVPAKQALIAAVAACTGGGVSCEPRHSCLQSRHSSRLSPHTLERERLFPYKHGQALPLQRAWLVAYAQKNQVFRPGFDLLQEKGLEPSLYCYNRHLKPARLPIPPLLRTADVTRQR